MIHMLDKDTVLQLLSTTSWFQIWEIVPGIFTPGLFQRHTKHIFDKLLKLPGDLSGKKILDIGAWDGEVSFELEARGAEVVALDIQDPDNTGFNVACKILGSNVRYVRASVYDLGKVLSEQFDIVFYFGVYYHLKDPITSFECIQKVLKSDGILYFDGECLLNYAEKLDGTPDGNLNIAELAKSEVPITLCYPRRFKSQENWFVPNAACLNSWLMAAGFQEMQTAHLVDDQNASPPMQRILASARKADRGAEEESLVYPKGWRNALIPSCKDFSSDSGPLTLSWGWHQLEDGYRWTGEKAQLVLRAPDGGSDFCLRGQVGKVDTEVLIEFSGKTVRVIQLKADEVIEQRFEVPAEFVGVNINVKISSTPWVPAEIGCGADVRTLGILVRYIGIKERV